MSSTSSSSVPRWLDDTIISDDGILRCELKTKLSPEQMAELDHVLKLQLSSKKGQFAELKIERSAFSRSILGSLHTNRIVTTLKLSGCEFGDLGGSAVGQLLAQNHTITSLSVQSNNIGVSGATALARALSSNTCLKRLFIGRNPLSDDGVAAIADALQSNDALRELEIADTQITDAGCTALAKLIKKNTRLASLTMYGQNATKITATGIERLLTALGSNKNLIRFALPQSATDAERTCLKTLLDRNLDHRSQLDGSSQNYSTSSQQPSTPKSPLPVQESALPQWLDSLVRMGADGPYVNLDADDLTEAQQRQFEQAISMNLSSRHGPICQLHIRADAYESWPDADYLLSSLQTNRHIRHLGLSSCGIGDAGALIMADVLTHNHTIQKLLLESNYIGQSGAKALSRALINNKGVEELYLYDNPIDDSGVTAIADALTDHVTGMVNISLKHLELGYTGLGDVAAAAVAEMMQRNQTITFLGLKQNDRLTEKGALLLMEALELNHTLLSFELPKQRHQQHSGLVDKFLKRNLEERKLKQSSSKSSSKSSSTSKSSSPAASPSLISSTAAPSAASSSSSSYLSK